MPIIIHDHSELHDSTIRAGLAGAGAALIGLFLPGWGAVSLTVAAVALAAAPPRRWSSAAWALWWAAAAGACVQLGGGLELGAPVALAASLARDRVGSARALAFGVGLLGAFAAALVGRAFAVTGALGWIPGGLDVLAGGAIVGALVGVGSLGRLLEPLRPSLEAGLHEVATEDEVGQLLARAGTAYRGAVEAIGLQAPAARAAADDLVRRMIQFGRRWREVQGELAGAPTDELRIRITELQTRLDGTVDPVTRAELGRAGKALRAQLTYIKEIERGRERAVARLEHQVAMLEQLRLQAVRHRSADAGRLGAELHPVVEDLAEAGADLDLAAEALSEATADLEAPGEPSVESLATDLPAAAPMPAELQGPAEADEAGEDSAPESPRALQAASALLS